MEPNTNRSLWNTLGHAATALVVGALSMVVVTGCGSREIVVEDDEGSPEAQQMLEYETQLLNRQMNQQNQQSQQPNQPQ